MAIPLAAIERVSKKAGVHRISYPALKELQRLLDELGLELALEAAQAARHAHRKTIMKQDIKLVSRKPQA